MQSASLGSTHELPADLKLQNNIPLSGLCFCKDPEENWTVFLKVFNGNCRFLITTYYISPPGNSLIEKNFMGFIDIFQRQSQCQNTAQPSATCF